MASAGPAIPGPSTMSQRPSFLKPQPKEEEWTLKENYALFTAVCTQKSGEKNWDLISEAIKDSELVSTRPPAFFSKTNCALQYKKLFDLYSSKAQTQGQVPQAHRMELVEEAIMNKLAEKAQEESMKIIINRHKKYQKFIEESKKYTDENLNKPETDIDGHLESLMKEISENFSPEELAKINAQDDTDEEDLSEDERDIPDLTELLKYDVKSLEKIPEVQAYIAKHGNGLLGLFDKLGVTEDDVDDAELKEFEEKLKSPTKFTSANPVSTQLFNLVKTKIAGTSEDTRTTQTTSPTHAPTLSMLLEMPPRGPGQPLPEIPNPEVSETYELDLKPFSSPTKQSTTDDLAEIIDIIEEDTRRSRTGTPALSDKMETDPFEGIGVEIEAPPPNMSVADIREIELVNSPEKKPEIQLLDKYKSPSGVSKSPLSTQRKVYSNQGFKLSAKRNIGDELKSSEDEGKEDEEKRITRARSKQSSPTKSVDSPSSETRATRSRTHASSPLVTSETGSEKYETPKGSPVKIMIDKEGNKIILQQEKVKTPAKAEEIKTEEGKDKEEEAKRVTRARAARGGASTPVKASTPVPVLPPAELATPTPEIAHQKPTEEHTETPRTTRSRASHAPSPVVLIPGPPVSISHEHLAQHMAQHNIGDSNPSSPSSTATTSTNYNFNVEDEKEHKIFKKQSAIYLTQISGHKNSSIFLKPIMEKDAPGYSKKVKRPVDLASIKKWIDSGSIRNFSSFERDLNLMFLNAQMFNAENTQLCHMAEEMANHTNEKLKEFKKSLEEVQKEKEDKEWNTTLRRGRRDASISESSKTPQDSEAEGEEEKRRGRKSLKRPGPRPSGAGSEKRTRTTRMQASSPFTHRTDKRLSPDIIH